MKLLVFAHTPPPHHGQSYMVKLMLDGLGGDHRKANGHAKSREEVREISQQIGLGGYRYEPIECYHVNARFSEDMEDIGAFRLWKVLLVLRYCLEAIWCRFRYGIDAFYYVPAPGKRAALYRDWIVMLLCRPFFRQIIHHWHAVGLGDWLQGEAHWCERWVTHRLLGSPALGIALTITSMRDALWFRSRKVEIIPNGVPDPCPGCEQQVLPRRHARVNARRKLLAGEPLTAEDRERAGEGPEIFRILFLAHCTAEKGLFDAVDAVTFTNSHLRGLHSPLRLHLIVAGQFLRVEEQREFEQRRTAPDVAEAVTYAGFVSGEQKAALLRDCDCLCFPTYYEAESFGLVAAEAMAAGQTIVATSWRALPEVLPPGYEGLVPPKSPARLADALVAAATRNDCELLRRHFLTHFVANSHLALLMAAFAQMPTSDGIPQRGQP